MANTPECLELLLKVLDSFLIPKCRLSNEVYLEMLISHLSGKYNQDYKILVKHPSIIKWIERAVPTWDRIEDPPASNIVSFTLRILALIIEDEWKFSSIKDSGILETIQNSLKRNTKLSTPSVKLANIFLLSSISKHSIGLQWIKTTKAWKIVLGYCQRNHTIYVVRDSKNFLNEIMTKFLDFMSHEDHYEEMLSDIFNPIFQVMDLWDEKKVVAVDEEEFQRDISPTMELATEVLFTSITKNPGNLVRLHFYLTDKHNLEQVMWKMSTMTQNSFFLLKIMKILVLLNCMIMIVSMPVDKVIGDVHVNNFKKFALLLFNILAFSICKGSGYNMFHLVELSNSLWKLSVKHFGIIPECDSNASLKFEDQLVALQLLPLYFIHFMENKEETECVEEYITKLLSITSSHTIRLCYSYRELLMKQGDAVLIATKSIQAVLLSSATMERTRAIFIFEALMFTLKPIVCPHSKSDAITRIPNFILAILNGIQTLVKQFKITWNESIDSTVLLNLMLHLLNNPNLTTRLAVQALKLTQLCIEQFMSPNMALLVNTIQNSCMEALGPVILKRMHDNDWETRDSTLELLDSMVKISEIKFPAFQQHILDNQICPLVFIMTKSDSEPYVRASALKCLQSMVPVQLLWEKSISSYDLTSHVLKLLANETEAIVRREGCLLMTTMYKHHKIPTNDLDLLFSTMAYSACNDLHWEVKTSAIKFWRAVIRTQFEHQGWIDGSFPTVTFSKDQKKIITLNEREILLRIRKILDELQLRGCLGVLLECLNDDCDFEVVKESVVVIKKVIASLGKYNYVNQKEKLEKHVVGPEKMPMIDSNYSEVKRTSLSSIESPQVRNNADIFGKATSEEVEKSSDQIIEAIVNSKDVNLLASAYENQMNVDENTETASEDEITIDKDNYKKYYVSIDVFLEKIYSSNLDELISQKNEWMSQTESFNSLLDDILSSFNESNRNGADCY